MPNIIDLKRQLAAGRTTSRALVEASLSAIADQSGEAARCFASVYQQSALAEAERVDAARARKLALAPFAGIPVSIKDLFDVAGEVWPVPARECSTRSPQRCVMQILLRTYGGRDSSLSARPT
jgi:aspartyl-tRNA(Asn)/glutamyl-tRNA(Gln) amidotransferase subunit A